MKSQKYLGIYILIRYDYIKEGGIILKKILVTLVLIIAFSGFSNNQFSAATSFPDLTDSNRFYDEIQYLTNEGIISGFPDKSFRPKADVTRGQAAIMLGRALGYDGTQRDTNFPDVDSSQVSSGYIAEAVKNKVISGYPDGTYRPGATVTRAEMAIILHRAFIADGETGNFTNFSDVSENMRSYQAIGDLASVGIVAGYGDGTFRPNVKLNREQFSAFLARAENPEEFAIKSEFGLMNVIFLDVGQGDATFIEYPNGKTALIDAGRYASVIEEALSEFGIEQIDTFIATHPDADHIGGAAHVIENYGVTQVIDSGLEHTTQTFINYLEAVDASGASFNIAEIGDDLSEDPTVTNHVLYVDSDASDLNDGSIVTMLSNGDIDYLLTGDAGVEVEELLIAEYSLDAEVLKVSHHGSRTGTSQLFVEAVDPFFAVLSYGSNGYGHPHDEVVNRLLDWGSEVVATENGSIQFSDDGEYLYFEQEKHVPIEPNPDPVDPGDGRDDLAITAKNLDTEVVTVKNSGTVNVDMTNWTLVSVEGNQTYTFPNGFVLKAGSSVNITSGPNAVDNPPSSLKWTGAYIWNNDGDAAELYDQNGDLVNRLP